MKNNLNWRKLPPIYEVPEENLRKEISELMKCGFFKDFDIEDAIAVAIGREILIAPSYNYWDTETNFVNKVEILRLDTKKTWIGSDDEIIYKGLNEYVNILNELSKISEENFNPTDTVEIWNDNNTINLKFKNENENHEINLKVNKDWADLNGLIMSVNKIISHTNYQFYFGPSLDIQIIGLHQKEFDCLNKKHKLRKQL